jgi:hypothetical protein
MERTPEFVVKATQKCYWISFYMISKPACAFAGNFVRKQISPLKSMGKTTKFVFFLKSS